MNAERFSIMPMSLEQEKKTSEDLIFIKNFLGLATEDGLRLVLSGGYGLDCLVHQITRPHNDVDLIVYGKKTRYEAIKIIEKYISQFKPQAAITTKNDRYYVEIDGNGNGFGANIYFVETVEDPFTNIQNIRLSDGTTQLNDVKRFPLPVMGNLNGMEIEAQNPNLHLADILHKRQTGLTLRKEHDQDIKNLLVITKD